MWSKGLNSGRGGEEVSEDALAGELIDALGQGGDFGAQAGDGISADLEQVGLANDGDGSGAGLLGVEGHFAEQGALVEMGALDGLGAAGEMGERPHLAAGHEVERLAGLPLSNDEVAVVGPYEAKHLDRGREELAGKLGKEGDGKVAIGILLEGGEIEGA